MAKPLSAKDKQWLMNHPDFHVVGKTRLGNPRKTNSDGSHTRAVNENDQSAYEMHRTFARKLKEAEDYSTMMEE